MTGESKVSMVGLACKNSAYDREKAALALAVMIYQIMREVNPEALIDGMPTLEVDLALKEETLIDGSFDLSAIASLMLDPLEGLPLSPHD